MLAVAVVDEETRRTIAGLRAQLDALARQVAYIVGAEDRINEAVADAIVRLREDTSRAINVFHVRAGEDRDERWNRQRALDRRLTRMERWQYARLAVEVLTAALIIGLWIGMKWF